jgi:hypothetical protein
MGHPESSPSGRLSAFSGNDGQHSGGQRSKASAGVPLFTS